MGVTDEGITLPQSTNAVATPTEPVTVEQTPGHPVSSGAVEAPPAAVTTEFGPDGTESTNTVPTPGAYKVVNTSVKVINAPRRAAAEGQTTAETEAQPASGRRAAAPADDAGH
jgi:hypothetical protein